MARRPGALALPTVVEGVIRDVEHHADHDPLVGEWPARCGRLSLHPALHVAGRPSHHRRPRRSGPPGDLRGRQPFCGQQHDPRPLRQTRPHGAGPGQRLRRDRSPSRSTSRAATDTRHLSTTSDRKLTSDTRDLRDVGAPLISFNVLTGHRSWPRRLRRARFHYSIAGLAPVSEVLPANGNFHFLEIRVQAIQLSPYHAGPPTTLGAG